MDLSIYIRKLNIAVRQRRATVGAADAHPIFEAAYRSEREWPAPVAGKPGHYPLQVVVAAANIVKQRVDRHAAGVALPPSTPLPADTEPFELERPAPEPPNPLTELPGVEQVEPDPLTAPVETVVHHPQVLDGLRLKRIGSVRDLVEFVQRQSLETINGINARTAAATLQSLQQYLAQHDRLDELVPPSEDAEADGDGGGGQDEAGSASGEADTTSDEQASEGTETSGRSGSSRSRRRR